MISAAESSPKSEKRENELWDKCRTNARGNCRARIRPGSRNRAQQKQGTELEFVRSYNLNCSDFEEALHELQQSRTPTPTPQKISVNPFNDRRKLIGDQLQTQTSTRNTYDCLESLEPNIREKNPQNQAKTQAFESGGWGWWSSGARTEDPVRRRLALPPATHGSAAGREEKRVRKRRMRELKQRRRRLNTRGGRGGFLARCQLSAVGVWISKCRPGGQ